MERLFTTLAAGRHRAQRPLPRLGLHGRERAQPLRADAAHPRRRVRAARRHDLADLKVAGHARRSYAGRPGTHRLRTRAATSTAATTARTTTIARERRAARASCRATSNTPGCPPGARVQSTARRDLPLQHPRQHEPRELHLHHPARRRRRARRPARPSLYGHGLLGSAGEVDRRQRQGAGERAQLRVLRDRLGRDVARRTSRTSAAILGDLSHFSRSPTAPSRGCSTSSTSAGC